MSNHKEQEFIAMGGGSNSNDEVRGHGPVSLRESGPSPTLINEDEAVQIMMKAYWSERPSSDSQRMYRACRALIACGALKVRG